MSAPPLASVDRGPLRARSVKRASASSDQTRVRDMFVAAILAVVAVVSALVATPGDVRSPGALARPHAAAKIACASCHARADGASPREACKGCHGETAHASTRPAHRALAASGALTCTTCHPAHGDAQGITFLGDGRFARWIGDRDEIATASPKSPLRATVPLVATAACTGCHDASSLRDPLAACLASPGAAVITCFDEHRKVDDPARAGASIACARQHTAARFVAWDAARAIAATPIAIAAPAATARAPWTWLGAGLSASLASLALIARLRTRRRRAARAHEGPLVPPPRVRLPRIDPSTCLGCYACVDACPFDVLEIHRYVAVVARPADCCGVILCAQACPNGSLQIDEGAPIDNRPRVDAHLESLDAPGVFLAGDLTGLPLIKNAINQGVKVVDRIAATLPRGRGACDADLIVIGAGPAGLSAMLRAKERGLRAVCFEQGALAASIRNFPRAKIVFDPPLDLPIEGSLWLREATKEELIAQWSRIARAHSLDIRASHRVTEIARDPAANVIVTSIDADGRAVTRSARRLVLAIGKRGTPRTLPLDVAPGADTKISYALADARSFAGAHVLIVGLGDAAMEAAIAIARQPDATVTVSYRGADFTRGKARNVAELRALAARGRVRIVFESHLERVDVKSATLRVDGRGGGASERIPNDAVLVLIGGSPSWELLHAAGVRLEKQASSGAIVPVENLLRRETSEAP